MRSGRNEAPNHPGPPGPPWASQTEDRLAIGGTRASGPQAFLLSPAGGGRIQRAPAIGFDA